MGNTNDTSSDSGDKNKQAQPNRGLSAGAWSAIAALIGVVGTLVVALINRPVSPTLTPVETASTFLQTSPTQDTPRPLPTDAPTEAPSATALPTLVPTTAPTALPTATSNPSPEPTVTPPGKVGGCGTTTTVRNWTQYENAVDKFRLAIPSNWSCAEFDPDTIDESLERASKVYSGAGEVFASDAMRQMVIKGLKLAAYDFESISGDNTFPVNITVFIEKLPIKLTLKGYTSLAIGNIKQLYGNDAFNESTTVALSGGEASRVKLTVPFGNVMVNRVLYILLKKD